MILITGPAIRMGKNDRPLSTAKRSALMRLINLPELVSVMLLIERLATLSYKAATRVLLILTDRKNPVKIYRFLMTYAIA